MKRIMNWLVPKEKRFFELLAEQSENTLEAAKELKNFVSNYDEFERSERKARIQSIKKLKDRVNELKHNIVIVLDKSFSASINKEDAYRMAVILENIADLINSVATKFVVLSIVRIDDYTTKLIDIMNDMTEELNNCIANFKKLKDIKERCEKIFKLEIQGDNSYNEALSELFHYHKNAVDIIKYKEIYELLKDAIDKCRDVADIIEDVVAKRA